MRWEKVFGNGIGNCFPVIVLFFTILLFHVDCALAQPLDSVRISARFKDTRLDSVFTALELQSGFPFFYKALWLEGKRYTGDFSDQPFPSVIAAIVSPHALSYAVYRNSAIVIAPVGLLSQEFSADYYRMKGIQETYMTGTLAPSEHETVTLGTQNEVPGRDGYQLTGTVSDMLEGQLLSGAAIQFKDLHLAVTTDDSGRFSATLTEGYHVAEVRMIGYDTRTFSLLVKGAAEWRVELIPEAKELDEVTVTGSAENSHVAAAFSGVTRLSPAELREMPAFLGEPDVIKSILTLPGISTVGEGAGGYNVRGGNIDQNLILQDGALVFNSSHAMGFFSIFNPDAIKEVTLYKGHIPARYGGRVSSVLDVQLKGHDYESTRLTGGIGLLSSRLMAETPLVKGKSSLLLGGRIAYSDWALNIVENRDVQRSSMDFYDLNMKISQRLGDRGSLALSAYNSRDYFRYSDQFGFKWSMGNYSLQWDQMLGKNLFSTFLISNSLSANASFQLSGIDGFTLNNGMNNYSLKEELLFTGWSRHTIDGGVQINAYIPKNETLRPFDAESTVIPYDGMKDRGVETAIYFNDIFDLGERVSVAAGLRFIHYFQPGPATVYHYADRDRRDFDNMVDSTVYTSGEKVLAYNRFDPRFSMRYAVNANSSIKISYNRINQFIHLISNTTAALPIDYWQMSNTWFAPLKADNFSAGYFRNFRMNQWETSVEVYYRKLQNLVDYKDFPELYLNRHLETELLSGSGNNYGIELFVKKKTGKLNGWVSYTFSRSFITIDPDQYTDAVNNGEPYPSKLDQPHNLNIVGNLHLNKTNTFSFNFVFNTGRPLTGPDANFSLDGYLVPNYSERNAFRLPDYHRMDLSYTIERGKLRTNRYKDSFTFSIYNVYARKNAYSVYFRRDVGNTFGGYKLAIIGTLIPSVTYNFQF